MKINPDIIGTAIAIFFVISIVFLLFYSANQQCIEYVDICQESYTHIKFNILFMMPLPTTDYRDVSCDLKHDKVIQRCVAWE